MFRNKKIYILMILILILVFALVIYSKDIREIKTIKDKKQAINEVIEVTTIDVTGILLGKETQHEHIYKTMYDQEKHWEECMSCGGIQNEKEHSFTRTWTLEIETCSSDNSFTDTCSCGYERIGHRPCVWRGEYIYLGGYKHALKCNICNHSIVYLYYLNDYGKGEVYNAEKYYGEKCYLSNGSKITCSNLGTCSKCNTSITSCTHLLMSDENTGIIYCSICKEQYGTVSSKITRNINAPTTYTIIQNINLTNGATFQSTNGMRPIGGIWEVNTQTITSGNIGESNITLSTVGTFNSSVKKEYQNYVRSYINIKGVSCEFIDMQSVIYPDSVEPVISNIVTKDETTLTAWSKTKPIVITGTENWTNTVNIEIVDDLGNSIFKGNTIVNNTNRTYSISCTPEIEVGVVGRRFKAIVTDACENKTEQEFEIARVDAIAPKITSSDEVDGNWAREKNFVFTATDHGIGNVQIGFNDVKDYSLAIQDGENFSKEYKLVGDVYAPREANVYYKDGLGNVSTKKITIDKLDNTAPTITNVNIHNNKLSVEANDRHETWGDGSGVVKYRYMVSGERIKNSDVSMITNELNVGEDIVIENLPEVKYVYVVAEDLVGNVSKVYEVEIPQLVLTSEVRLELANGKGGVKLDWSTYDISDKYFVIYRKKENETEWQEIVSLQDKLTENTYIDEFANDNENSNAPTIQIQENIENNNINISPTSTDNGSKYTYYIESYDSSTNLLLNKSN